MIKSEGSILREQIRHSFFTPRLVLVCKLELDEFFQLLSLVFVQFYLYINVLKWLMISIYYGIAFIKRTL